MSACRCVCTRASSTTGGRYEAVRKCRLLDGSIEEYDVAGYKLSDYPPEYFRSIGMGTVYEVNGERIEYPPGVMEEQYWFFRRVQP